MPYMLRIFIGRTFILRPLSIGSLMKILWKGLAACFLSLLMSEVLWAGLPNTIDKVRASIVGVGSVFPTKRLKGAASPLTFKGTGFVVGNGKQVVTNYHVIVKPLNEKKHEKLAVFSGKGKKATIRMAKIVATDPDHDLALLEFTGPALPSLELGDSNPLREGEDVAFTGFPIGLVLGLNQVTHRGIISAVTPMVIPALSSKTLTAEQIKRVRQPFNVYQLDATAYPGNSGSPVYEVQSGIVVGVINSVFVKKTKEAMLKDPSDISYAIPVKYVKDLLVGH